MTRKIASSKTLYHAHYELDPSGNWLADVEEIPQVHTFGRTLGKAEEHLWDALALWLNVHVLDLRATADLERKVDLPPNVEDAVRLALGAREMLEAITNETATLTAAAALAVVDDAHLSVRDAAALLNMSHQRVHQIVSTTHTERRAAEVRKNLAAVQQHIEKNQAPQFAVGQLTPSQTLLLAAVLVVGGAALIEPRTTHDASASAG